MFGPLDGQPMDGMVMYYMGYRGEQLTAPTHSEPTALSGILLYLQMHKATCRLEGQAVLFVRRIQRADQVGTLAFGTEQLLCIVAVDLAVVPGLLGERNVHIDLLARRGHGSTAQVEVEAITVEGESLGSAFIAASSR